MCSTIGDQVCTGPQDVTYDEYGRKNRIHLYSKKSSEDLEKKVNALKRYFQVVINSALEKPRSCQQIKLTFKQIVCEATKEQLLPANAMQTICEDIELPKYKATEKRRTRLGHVLSLRIGYNR